MADVKFAQAVLNSAASSTSITLPSDATTGPVADDTIIAFWISLSTITYSALGTSGPSGYSNISTADQDVADGLRYRTYRKTAVAGDSGATVTCPSPGAGAKVLVVLVVGRVSQGSTGGIDGTPTKAGSTTAALTGSAAAVTTTAAYSLLIALVLITNSSAVAGPAGFSTAQAAGVQAVALSSVQTVAGSSGAKTFSWGTSSGYAVALLGIRGDGNAPPSATTSADFAAFFGL